MQIQLKMRDISEEIFDNVLKNYIDDVVIVNNIGSYYNGYDDKWKIVYNGKDTLICQEYLVEHIDKSSLWKQVIYRKCINLDKNTIVETVTGTYAWNYINKQLLKYYNKDEINNCLYSHEAEYDENLIQQHYFYGFNSNQDVILKHTNCYKYDINGAHNDALREIFPKAAKMFEKLYKDRKVKPLNKAFVNYYVGSLCRHGYRKTYNWIVQRTTRQLIAAADYLDGRLIYANTDGLIVSNPKNLIEPEPNVLGKFKLEYQGDTYTYQGFNYFAVQTNELKGNLPIELKDSVDLSKGQVIKYTRNGIKDKDGKVIYFNYENIELLKVDIKNEN